MSKFNKHLKYLNWFPFAYHKNVCAGLCHSVCVCLLICFCYFLLFVPYLSIWFLRCARARSLTIEFYCYFPHLFSICLMFNKVTAGKYDISFRFFFVLLKSGHCKINYWQYCMLYPFSDRLFLLLHH